MKGEEISAYPKDLHIFFKGTHRSWDYIIINEGVYPPEQHAIPDQYIVRTIYGKKIYCRMLYPIYQ